MKRIAGMLVLVILAGLAYSCRKDVFIDAPPSLLGDYTGTYSVKRGSLPPEEWPVTFRFLLAEFSLRLDEAARPRPQAICDHDGMYTIGASVTMAARCGGDYSPATCATDPNATAQQCNQDLDAYGTFVLEQTEAGDVTLTSYTPADSTRKILTLHPLR
jgi:hypothetical protein